MLKVVLVDDEPSVLEGLHIFVDWQGMGFEIVGEASDGLASFPLICDTQPELVICDIRMPGLNGLELIEKVNANIKPVPKFIILSGYDDFSYAQKALQLGAVGYLVKPLDVEELKSELSRAACIIENERNARQESLELIRHTANQLYNDIMGGKRSERLRRKARFLFDIPEKAKIQMVQFIADEDEENNSTPKNRIYTLLMRLFGISNENCVFYSGSGSYIVVRHDSMRAFSCDAKFAEQLAQQLRGISPENYGMSDFWALIGSASDNDVLESIYKCGKQLEQLHTYCMLHPESKVVYYEAMHKNPVFHEHPGSGTGMVFPELPFNKVVNALKGNCAQEVAKAVDDFFYELDRSGGSRRLYSIHLYRLADVIRKMTYAYGIEASKVLLKFTKSVDDMSPNCKKLALDMCNYIFEKQNANNIKPLSLLEDEIIGYIRANCRKNLSLQSIAENFSLPAVIISKIVKKKTGRKFNDYLNYLRIEYAKTLFASADMKIAAVSREAGYTDYGYFIEKFKEFTGVSPSEYKKRYS
jgi:two-component system response regulator YesN